MRIAFIADGGWKRLEVALDGRVHASHLFGDDTDAPGDLVRAALHLACGAAEASLILDGEPDLQILRYHLDPWSTPQARSGHLTLRTPDPHEEPLWSLRVEVDVFARAVLAAVRPGVEGRNAPPVRGLRALAAALDA